MSVKILAPAKINIGLRVCKREDDGEYRGFHQIESIFQTVNLFDELEVDFLDLTLNGFENAERFGRCVVQCDSMKLPESNTLTKTFDSFSRITGLKRSVRVILKKNIPSGGGLGGGSADGAYFLRALAQLNSVELTRKLAFSVASEVGSDVFFFLGLKSGFGAAVVTGRGEIVSEIESRKLNVVLVFPDVFSSTKEAYSLLDEFYEKEGLDSDCPNLSEYEALYRRRSFDWRGDCNNCGFKNSFTSVMCRKYPLISDAISDLNDCGADFSEMSGSGSTVFGVFEDENIAKSAVSKLSLKWRCVLA